VSSDIQGGRRRDQNPGTVYISLFVVGIVDADPFRSVSSEAWIPGGRHVFVVLLCVVSRLNCVLQVGDERRRGVVLRVFVGGRRGARLLILTQTVLFIALVLILDLFDEENCIGGLRGRSLRRCMRSGDRKKFVY